MMNRIFLLFSAVSLWRTTAAEMIEIGEWKIPGDGLPYLPRTAIVGDSVTFQWVGGNLHNVYLYPSMDCTVTDNAILVGDTSPTVYTFQEADGSQTGKEHFFACDVGGHCEAGMNIIFTVFSTQADFDVVSGGAAGGGEPSPTPAPVTASPEAQPTEAQPTEAQPTEAQPTEAPTAEDDSASSQNAVSAVALVMSLLALLQFTF